MSNSRDRLGNLTAFGVVLNLGGWVAWAIASEESGDNATLVQIVSLVIAGIGSALLFVGLVGFGVLFALRTHAEEQAVEEA